MHENTILDHEPVTKSWVPLLHKTTLAIEISLWLFIIISNEQPWRHDVQFFLRKTLGPSNESLMALLIALFFYLLFPILIFRSRNWKQHLLSHFCGLVIFIWILSIFFHLEAWPGEQELTIASLLHCLVLTIVSFIMFLIKFRTKARNFFLNIFIRMAILLLLVGTVFCKYFYIEISLPL
jgi:hypothetical protein